MGRPSDYTPELAEEICLLISEGQSMRSICARPSMPDRSTVFRWLADNPDFATKYARARELQADHLFDEMQDVADVGNPDDVQRARLRVGVMQWRAAKLAPKKYGDKIDVEHSGGVTVVGQALDEAI